MGDPSATGFAACEFDDFLLKRCGVRAFTRALLLPGWNNRADRWIVNDQFKARLVIGAGGHFCPCGPDCRGAKRSA